MNPIQHTNGNDIVQDIYYLISEMYNKKFNNYLKIYELTGAIPKSTILFILERAGRSSSDVIFDLAIIIPPIMVNLQSERAVNSMMRSSYLSIPIESQINSTLIRISKATIETHKKMMEGNDNSSLAFNLRNMVNLTRKIFGNELNDRFFLELGFPQEVIDNPDGFE
jgi:hypothetical protein